MSVPDEIKVKGIYDKAWKVGEIDPLEGDAATLSHFLDTVREFNVKLLVETHSRIEGGPFDGGHVVTVDAGDGRSYFLVPPEAAEYLRDYLSAEDYERFTNT